jgi:hypothetical protein
MQHRGLLPYFRHKKFCCDAQSGCARVTMSFQKVEASAGRTSMVLLTKGVNTVPMTALGAETRRVSDELLAREADARRTLVLFALALAVALGTVLGVLGAGSMGALELQAATLRLPAHGAWGGLAGLAGLAAFAALAISGASWLLTRQRTA